MSGLEIYLWLHAVLYGLAIVTGIALIGKPRKVLTPGVVIGSTIIEGTLGILAAKFALGL